MTSKLIQSARILHPPVNLQKIAELYAPSIVYHDSPEFSYTIKYKGRFFICLHKSGNLLRDRWSFAHELGHIALNHFSYLESQVMFSLSDICAQDNALTVQSDSTSLSDEQRYILEREADLFAEELLLPRTLLQPCLYKHPSLDQLSNMFQVSKEALAILLNKINSYEWEH